MKNVRLTIAICLFAAATSHAEGSKGAQYLYTKDTNVESSFNARLGLGMLDTTGAPGDGVLITNQFGARFAATPDLQLNLILPLGGTISNGPDGFGIGNIAIGAKYILPLDRLQIGVGVDAALPSGQSDAAIAGFTLPLELYAYKWATVAPYVVASFVGDRLTLTADLGNKLLISTESAASNEVEDALSYDVAFAHAFGDHMWASVEFGGYSFLSDGAGLGTSLYAGPGIRYQDDEVALGVHLNAPFRSPARDVYDFEVVFDVKVYF
jgi:hypothetical protein